LTVVATHPVQYASPWFRYITDHCPQLDLSVVYASRPSREQQGAGFGRALEWDIPLLDGYRWHLVRESRPGDSFATGTFRGLDVAEIGAAVLETRPDVVLVPGWHSITLVRAIMAARRHRIPVIYRGDTHLAMRPSGWRRLGWDLKTRAALGLYSAYLSVGHLSRAYLLGHGIAPTAIYDSPHAVDNDGMAIRAAPHLTEEGRSAVRAEWGVGPEEFVVLYVGKLTTRKRVIDAVHGIAGLGSNTVLVIAGTGEEERELRAEAERIGARVVWLGFVNQSRIAAAYAAADCLVLPSESESWGLAVNEAMATGLPAVVTDRTGCHPDLVVPGETGEVFRTHDRVALTAALARVRDRGGREAMSAACRATVARHDFEAATTGLLAACQSVALRNSSTARVIACCGGMVLVSGLERMTFEVLRVVREHGGSVHCILNSWENHRIVTLTEQIGATWSTGFYYYGFSRRTWNPVRHAQSLWDIARTSAGLLRDAARFRPTHVLVPEYSAVLRNAPAIAILKAFGVDIVFRIGNAPERGRVYDLLWGHVLPPFVTRFVPNSRFGHVRLEESGVPAGKITLIRNALSRRTITAHTDDEVVRLAALRPTILTVGQIAPFKGTHLTVEAVLQLLREGCDVQAVIVGALPSWPPEFVAYARELRERVEAARAGDRVHFVGIRENVPAIMQASYLLAAPILQEETFGNVVLEARSVGLPAVTFERGALTEIVAHGRTGYVCATADLDGLLDGLRHFLRSPGDRARASAAALAESTRPDDECGPSEFERRWWALFERAS
jgi:glycosyltransferase involved in cell wall biosynthesis